MRSRRAIAAKAAAGPIAAAARRGAAAASLVSVRIHMHAEMLAAQERHRVLRATRRSPRVRRLSHRSDPLRDSEFDASRHLIDVVPDEIAASATTIEVTCPSLTLGRAGGLSRGRTSHRNA